MNYLQALDEIADNRANDMDENAKLKIENALLREAVEHYFHCRTCAEDSVYSCAFGYKYAQLLNLISPDEKAV